MKKIQNPVFVIWAFTFQLLLIIHFTIRITNFEFAINYGWVIYLLSLVGLIVSIQQIKNMEGWVFWIGGFIFLTWAIFGFLVEYIFNISWRLPIIWPIFIPYISLYLATVVFYWWPLGKIKKTYWYVYSILFVISTYLNVASHFS